MDIEYLYIIHKHSVISTHRFRNKLPCGEPVDRLILSAPQNQRMLKTRRHQSQRRFLYMKKYITAVMQCYFDAFLRR